MSSQPLRGKGKTGDKRTMVERKKELRRQRARRKKLFKLKDKMARAKDGKEKDQVLLKIQQASPWWKQAVAAK